MASAVAGGCKGSLPASPCNHRIFPALSWYISTPLQGQLRPALQSERKTNNEFIQPNQALGTQLSGCHCPGTQLQTPPNDLKGRQIDDEQLRGKKF